MRKTIIQAEKGAEKIFETDYKATCNRLKISYNASKMKKFPFTYKGWNISKIRIEDHIKNFEKHSKKEITEILEVANKIKPKSKSKKN